MNGLKVSGLRSLEYVVSDNSTTTSTQGNTASTVCACCRTAHIPTRLRSRHPQNALRRRARLPHNQVLVALDLPTRRTKSLPSLCPTRRDPTRADREWAHGRPSRSRPSKHRLSSFRASGAAMLCSSLRSVMTRSTLTDASRSSTCHLGGVALSGVQRTISWAHRFGLSWATGCKRQNARCNIAFPTSHLA